MGQLRERIGLVHKLRQLATAEKFFYCRRYGLKADEVMRHHLIEVMDAHALPDGSFHADQADAKLIFQEFPYRSHTPVPQMIDIVYRPTPFAKVEQIANHRHNIGLG